MELKINLESSSAVMPWENVLKNFYKSNKRAFGNYEAVLDISGGPKTYTPDESTGQVLERMHFSNIHVSDGDEKEMYIFPNSQTHFTLVDGNYQVKLVNAEFPKNAREFDRLFKKHATVMDFE